MGKQGIINRVLDLNRQYNQFTNSDLQGIVMVIAMDIVKSNKSEDLRLKMEISDKILMVLNRTKGETSMVSQDFIRFQIGQLKSNLKKLGYKVL